VEYISKIFCERILNEALGKRVARLAARHAKRKLTKRAKRAIKERGKKGTAYAYRKFNEKYCSGLSGIKLLECQVKATSHVIVILRQEISTPGLTDRTMKKLNRYIKHWVEERNELKDRLLLRRMRKKGV